MSKEFVDALAADNNLEAEKAFSISMTNKVGDALEVKRKEVSKTFVSNVLETETDD
tara:strand:- start:154 stop:321 length:168 start_codon:yes stop_codon:yes gene_type:complete